MSLDAKAMVNSTQIAYQLHGDPDHPTILLIHGLSTPLTGWPVLFVEHLVKAGYQVLLLDNRDSGRSDIFDHASSPNVLWALLKLKLGLRVKTPYTLEDMMKDTVALLDYLKLDKVHVVGASMGGMIAQLLSIHHPERVMSLCSIMSTTGTKKLPAIHKDVRDVVMRKPASTSDADIKQYHMDKWRAIGSPAYPARDEYLNTYVDSMLARGTSPRGTVRQMLAILTAKNREPALRKLQIPSLVLHGDQDGLVNVFGGKATAAAIPNATLKLYPGMGHDLPVALIPQIAKDILAHLTCEQGTKI